LFLGIDSAPSRFLPKSQIKKKREKGEGTRNKGKLKRAREKQGRRCHQNLNYSRISKLFVKGSKILEREREREREKERKKERKKKRGNSKDATYTIAKSEKQIQANQGNVLKSPIKIKQNFWSIDQWS